MVIAIGVPVSSPPLYAQPSDLATWLSTGVPAGALPLLRSATVLVGAACQRNPYTDQPSPADAAALRDATCSQVSTWLALNINPATAGSGVAPKKSSKIATGDVQFDTSVLAKQQLDALTVLSPEASAILNAAGLLFAPGPLSDTDPYLLTYGLPLQWPFDWNNPEQYGGAGTLGVDWPFQ